MRQTPSKMYMRDMVTIDTILYDIAKASHPPPPGSLTFSNIPDRIALNQTRSLISRNSKRLQYFAAVGVIPVIVTQYQHVQHITISSIVLLFMLCSMYLCECVFNFPSSC